MGWLIDVGLDDENYFQIFEEVRLGRRSLTPKNDFHVNLYVFHLMKFFLRLNHNINNVFDAEERWKRGWPERGWMGALVVHDKDEWWCWLMSLTNLLERVAQLVFDQRIVTTYHNCATSSEISAGEIRRRRRISERLPQSGGSNDLLQELWQNGGPSASVLFEC